MTIIGIDPGLSGGIAVYDGTTGDYAVTPLPIAGGELDLHAITLTIADYMNPVVCIEKVGAMPKQGVVSTFKFGKGYGALLGICAALGVRVELVTPQAWKKVVLAGTTKDKGAAIAYVRRAFPQINLIPDRCRVPHDGMADAICIAEYGRRTFSS